MDKPEIAIMHNINEINNCFQVSSLSLLSIDC